MQQKRQADKKVKSQQMRRSYSHQTGFCMRRRERKWGKAIYEEQMAEKFQELMKDENSRV